MSVQVRGESVFKKPIEVWEIINDIHSILVADYDLKIINFVFSIFLKSPWNDVSNVCNMSDMHIFDNVSTRCMICITEIEPSF